MVLAFKLEVCKFQDKNEVLKQNDAFLEGLNILYQPVTKNYIQEICGDLKYRIHRSRSKMPQDHWPLYSFFYKAVNFEGECSEIFL